MNPLFSIVIANFNGGKYLEEAVSSILRQEFTDYEIIIVDGGSTDQSIEVIERYSNCFSWWASESDNGQSDAFNKGFSRANGRYYFWINSDDLLLPGSLTHAARYIDMYKEFNWFAANTIFFTADKSIVRCSRGPEWSSYLFDNAPIAVYGPTTIFHRSLFEASRRFDQSLHYSMDTDMWCQFKSMGFKFKRIPKYFWGFRVHELSKTSRVLLGYNDSAYSEEQHRMLLKNNVRYQKGRMFAQRTFKLLSGLYLRSWVDSMVYRGTSITSFKG